MLKRSTYQEVNNEHCSKVCLLQQGTYIKEVYSQITWEQKIALWRNNFEYSSYLKLSKYLKCFLARPYFCKVRPLFILQFHHNASAHLPQTLLHFPLMLLPDIVYVFQFSLTSMFSFISPVLDDEVSSTFFERSPTHSSCFTTGVIGSSFKMPSSWLSIR